MKKITLLAIAIVACATSFAQTVSLSAVTTADVTVDASDIPVAMTPNTPFVITISGFTASSSVTVFNQFKNAAGQQFAGGSIAISTNSSGNGSATFNPGFFGGGDFTMDQSVNWNSETGGDLTSPRADIDFDGTYDSPTLGTFELNALQEATVSPNPTKGSVTILGSNATINTIEVFNTAGNLVGNSTDLSNLSTGVYLMKIYTNSGSVTKKVVKQ